MEYVILKKKDMETSINVVNLNDTVDIVDKKGKAKDYHACRENCNNCYTSKCLKVADRLKRTIDEYSFIEEGKQIFMPIKGYKVNPKITLEEIKEDIKKGKIELISFVVNKCNSYEQIKEKPKKTTEDSKITAQKVRNAKEYLLLYFTGASTREEAEDTLVNLINSGAIKGNGSGLTQSITKRLRPTSKRK